MAKPGCEGTVYPTFGTCESVGYREYKRSINLVQALELKFYFLHRLRLMYPKMSQVGYKQNVLLACSLHFLYFQNVA